MRPDVTSWIIPPERFNNSAWVEARVTSVPEFAQKKLRTALSYLYFDDGVINLPRDALLVAERVLEPAEAHLGRWLYTRTNGSERKRYGTDAVKAARLARHRCSECGHPDVRTLQIDHVEGRVGPTALQCLCANCHQIKTKADSAKRNALAVE